MLTVVHGFDAKEINKIYHEQVTGPDGEWHLVSFKVIKEATLEDLKKYIKEQECIDTGFYGKYFYFVQMD